MQRNQDYRVKVVHAQTKQGLLISIAFVVCALLAGLFNIGSGWWLGLHLFGVGALLSAIGAVTQMLAVTWSSSPAPTYIISSLQRWLLVCGAILMVVGREVELLRIAESGAFLVIVSMSILMYSLVNIRQGAKVQRFFPAIEAYILSIVLGILSTIIAMYLLSATFTKKSFEFRNIHIVLNVFGLIGLIIAATLPYFTATQVRSKMSKLATPINIRIVLFSIVISLGILCTGYYIAHTALTFLGFILYAICLVCILGILPIYKWSRYGWAGPRLFQLISGILWWIALTIMMAFNVSSNSNTTVLLRTLVIGAFGQILISSLCYLGPVLKSSGHKMLTAGFGITRSWTSLLFGNFAALCSLLRFDKMLSFVLIAWLAEVVIRGAALLKLSDDKGNDQERL